MDNIQSGGRARRSITLDLSQDTFEELGALAQSLGFTREMAAEYCVRMISACVREGLIEDVPARAWPQEAALLTGTGGKVLAFPRRTPERRKAPRA